MLFLLNSRHGLAGKDKTKSRGRIPNIGAKESTWEELLGGWRKIQSEELVSDNTRVVMSKWIA